MSPEAAQTPEGYCCEGTHTIVRWRAGEGVTLFVARASMRGRPWLRFLRKIDRPGWWVTAYKTKAEAVD